MSFGGPGMRAHTHNTRAVRTSPLQHAPPSPELDVDVTLSNEKRSAAANALRARPRLRENETALHTESRV